MPEQIGVVLHFDQCSLVKEQKVLISAVATIVSADEEMRRKIGRTELFYFPKRQKEKKVFSVMKVIAGLAMRYPEVEVTTLGEPDFIVEYKPEKRSKWTFVAEWSKTAAVALAVFVGSAFTIMTFNKDSSVEEIFAMIYRLSEGTERSAPGELEIAYSIGLPLGIILFFNHFFRKKIDSDPTPLQVQMRQYEKDVNATIIDNATREGKKENV